MSMTPRLGKRECFETVPEDKIMDPALYIVAMVSFLLGSFGYVTAKYIIIPIARYGKLKRRAARLLARYGKNSAADENSAKQPSGDSGFKKKLRQLSADLADCWMAQLPHWYKLYIEGRRQESPLDAATQLMTLANTRNREHAGRQMETIKSCLKLNE